MSVAAEIRAAIDAAPTGTFIRVADFGAPPRAVESAFSRLLASRSDLRRARKGVYWKGATSEYGPGLPDAVGVAAAITEGRGAGLTGWAASAELGLSTQVPVMSEVAVVGAAPSATRWVRFHSRSNLARLNLNWAEVTTLEVLRAWPKCVEAGWDETAKRVRELDASGKISLDRLAAAVRTERHVAARERVRSLRAAA